MAAPASQGPNMEVFDAYFQRADLDKDGRISGAEAVAFFQGSNLPKHVLAQIWTYADQNRTSFLGRPEFYNALKLVTVAQSGRELTPDIVKSALFGPAAAKIPAPQINPVSTAGQMNVVAAAPVLQSNSVVPPSTQMGVTGASASQNLGFRGPQPPNVGMNQQFSLPPNNHNVRPPQAYTSPTSLPPQGNGPGLPGGGSVTGPGRPILNTPNISTDWFGGRTVGSSVGSSQYPVRGATPAASSIPSKPQDPVIPASQAVAKGSKPSDVSGNGFSSDSIFGGDVFSATPVAKQETAMPSFSGNNVPSSSSLHAGSQNPTKPGQNNVMQSTATLPQGNYQGQQAQPLVNQSQTIPVQSASSSAVSSVPAGPVGSSLSQSQTPWPRITQSDIQKYSKVFMEVDKDRDGKITGEEARSLFLSWRLPREVLRQVWDLSDQDNDSMLSLREFCTALYLMERFREGRTLPAVLPNSLRFDETLMLATSQSSTAYGGPTWQPTPGPGLPQQRVPAPHPVVPARGMEPPSNIPVPTPTDDAVEAVQQKSKVPVLEKHLVNQLSNEEQSALNSKFQEAMDADKKVHELEKEILDSKEKIEYYRTKMQELVLYKSRCDNRLNEITERQSTDKREVESLAKKYEEKYKQSGDVASKLSVEEATFRDIQERKLELYNTIIKMEQGGTGDGVLQVRADSIQSDLEELVKSLNDRCKQYGLRAKPTTLVELPFGWQPGIQEGAADWDEEWDKFQEEGFTTIKELTLDVENVVAPPKPKPSSIPNEKPPTETNEASPVASSASSLKDDGKMEKPATNGEVANANESDHANKDEPSKSPPDTPGRSVLGSPRDYNSSHFGLHDNSPHAKENSDHGGVESTFSSEKYPDERSWGATFDSNDDTDSVWGFSAINTKATDHERITPNSFFDFGEPGLNPIRTESPSAASVFGKESKSPFFDSVPSTPVFNSSPRFNDGPGDHSFDTFGRFDSFSMQDSGFFPQRQSLTRFDSMRSSADSEFFPPNDSFARYDSTHGTSDSGFIPPPESFARFDSIHSTADHVRGFPSFDDADPFGSTGPFKSSESDTPKRGSDNWRAF